MSKRKPVRGDLEFLDKKMEIIKTQMDNIEDYLSSHRWNDIEDPDLRQKEVKLQRDLSDALLDWSEKYSELCGILDVYRKMEEAKGSRTLKAGQQVSGVQELVKEYSRLRVEEARSKKKKKTLK